MSRYRKVPVRIWSEERFRCLSERAKLVYFMVLTHPSMTSLGAMRATIPGLADEIDMDTEAFREAFREAFANGLLESDEKAKFVAIPDFLTDNQPESPNVVRAWASVLDVLPNCNLKSKAIQRAKGFAEAKGEAFAKAFREAFGKGMPNQEQEQEQEKEQKQEQEQEKEREKEDGATAPPQAPPADLLGGKGETEKPKRKPKLEATFRAWLAACEQSRQDPISAEDPVWQYAEHAGIQPEWVELAWAEFRARYLESRERYADWRAHFRNAVRRNWFRLWWLKPDGAAELTTAGVQAQRVAAAQAAGQGDGDGHGLGEVAA